MYSCFPTGGGGGGGGAALPILRRCWVHYVTACGDGKIPFVSATDIAAAAFHALTDTKLHNTDYRILGPELLTYDEVYRIFSSNLHGESNAEDFHTDCGKVQQRPGTRGRACQTLRGTKLSTVLELGRAGTLRKVAFLH